MLLSTSAIQVIIPEESEHLMSPVQTEMPCFLILDNADFILAWKRNSLHNIYTLHPLPPPEATLSEPATPFTPGSQGQWSQL